MPQKKRSNAPTAAPKPKAAPKKKKGTAATREARRWFEECEGDSDDTSSSAGQGRGPVPLQAGGTASGGDAAVGQQLGSAVSVGSSSSLGAGTGAAENAVEPASVPAIGRAVRDEGGEPAAEPTARALRERERRAANRQEHASFGQQDELVAHREA